MDYDAFDRFTRLLGTPGSRRIALGVLIGSGVLGAAEPVFSRKSRRSKRKGKDKQQTNAKKRRDAAAKQDSGTEPTPDDGIVAVEAADCSSPGPSSNLKDCNFNHDVLDGYDLSSSNMKNTKFNGASLCGADLSSSTLTNADLRNANLTKADLHSSGCNGIKTNAGTTFCQTIMCNGNINNSDCPGAAPGSICCNVDDCAERVCQTATCSDNGCEYADQDDGAPGTLCSNQCCDVECCPDGQKCCAGDCIPNASCCEADCAADEKCCGAECIADSICCTDGDPGECPPNQQCCPGSDIPAVDDGGTCKQAIGQTCTDPDHPELDCCFPDFCCKNDTDDGLQCKAGSGKPCIGNDDCCNDAGLFCGTIGSNTVCCISQTGHACNPSVTPCCSPFVCDPDEFECVLPD